MDILDRIRTFLRRVRALLWHSHEETRGSDVFAADTPINAATEDLLGRVDFARALAKVLYHHRGNDSLVVGLRGEWGSGKTSVKNLVVEALHSAEEGPMRVVEFNPWQWGGEEAITRAFFREIAVALGDTDKSLSGRRRAYEFRQYAAILEQFSGNLKSFATQSASIVGWFGSLGLLILGAGLLSPGLRATELSALLLIGSGVLLGASKIFAIIGRDTEDARPLDIARARLEARLKTLSRNILVVVDDIDRLEPAQIQLVIRHVKANANLPGLTYLLLFQREVVERALDQVGDSDGRKYLEKIVQATFDVPFVEGARVERIALAELDKLVSRLPQDQRDIDEVRWGNVWRGGLRHLFRNLRDVRRYLGGLEVQLELHRGTRVLETNLIDTIALEAIRLFEPEVFADIAKSKELLTRTQERHSSEKEVIRTLLARASPENSEAVQEIAKQLFPRVGWAWGGSHYGPDWTNSWIEERRICSRRHFNRYFALRVENDQISDSEFLDFVDNSDNRAHIDHSFADFRERDLLPELLGRLDESSAKLPLANADVLLPAIFDVGEEFQNTLGFSTRAPFISAWRTATWYLRREPDLTRRGELFLRALGRCKGLAVPAALIGLDIDKRKKDSGEDDFTLRDDQLEESKRLWVEKMTNLAQDPVPLFRNAHFISFLYRWRDYTGEQEPRNWLQSIADRPSLLPKLLLAFSQERETLTMGDYVTRKTSTFSFEGLWPFVDLPHLVELVQGLPPNDLDESEQHARAAFLAAAKEKTAQCSTSGTPG